MISSVIMIGREIDFKVRDEIIDIGSSNYILNGWSCNINCLELIFKVKCKMYCIVLGFI